MFQNIRVTTLERHGKIDRFEHGTGSFLESHILSKSVGNDENVGKKDRRIEAEAPDRLKGHLASHVRGIAKIEEAARFPPRFPVF